jgi:hypothetical protein
VLRFSLLGETRRVRATPFPYEEKDWTMLKRVIAATFVSGMMLLSVPHAAFADGRHRGGHDRRAGQHDNRRDGHGYRDHDGHRGYDRHRGYDSHRGHDRDRHRNGYSRRYGYDRGYYGYYGYDSYGCDGYRNGYYYGSDGRRSYRDSRSYDGRNHSCGSYYSTNGTYWG